MAAGCATLDHIRDSDYLERMVRVGTVLRNRLQQQAASHGYTLRQTGPVQMPQILFEEDPDFRRGFCWTAEAVKPREPSAHLPSGDRSKLVRSAILTGVEPSRR